MSRQIQNINQHEAKKSLSPYDKPIHKDGPSIVDDTEGEIVIFDGWQNLPPQNLNDNIALERAFIRSINIQRQQIRNRVTFYHDSLQQTMMIKDIVDPFVLREKEEKKARAIARQTFIELTVEDSDD